MPYNPGQGYGQPTSSGVGQTFLGGLTATQVDELFGTKASELGLPVAPGAHGSLGDWIGAPLGLNPDQLYQMQQEMQQAGFLTEAQVTGFVRADPADPTLKAWKYIVDTTAASYNLPGGAVSPSDFLRWSAASGNYESVAMELKKRVSDIQNVLSSPKPVSVTTTDSNALRDQLASTFTDALGYGPTDAQVNSYVGQEHSAQVSAAEGAKTATVEAYQSELNRAKGEERQLIKLGPDGIDSFLQAYQSVVATHQQQLGIHNLAQGPTQTVPSNQLQPVPTSQVTTPGIPPAQAPQQRPAPGQPQPVIAPRGGMLPVAPGGGSNIPGDIANAARGAGNLILGGTPNPENSAIAQAFGSTGSAPPSAPRPQGTPGYSGTLGDPLFMHGREGYAARQTSNQTYAGGTFGLSPQAWQWGLQHLNLSSSTYPDPASASPGVQHAIALAYAQHEFQQYGNWGDVASMMAAGKPLAQMKDQPTFQLQNGQLTMVNFADQIVGQVNDALKSIQTSLNAPGASPVVVRQSPDPSADAAAMARESDPTGYIANQTSYYYGYLNQMLYGAPTVQDKNQSGVTGGVGEAAPMPSGPVPATATATGG